MTSNAPFSSCACFPFSRFGINAAITLQAEEAAGEPLQAEGAGAVAEALAVSNKSSENLMQHSVSR